MANLNRTVLGGVVAQEPDIRMVGQGDKATKIARFALQIARGYGETYDYVTCVAFGKQAEWLEANNIHVQSALVIKDGRIQTGSYTDANGKKVYTTEVVCTSFGLGSVYLNKSLLSGNLVRDPEVRYTGQGQDSKVVCHFTVAVKRRFSRENEETDFILCTAFGKQGEFVSKQFMQGDNIIIDDGRIQTGSYTNKDGETVYTTEVIANSVEFGESKSSRDARRNGVGNGYQPAAPAGVPQQMPQQSPQQPMGAAPMGVTPGMPPVGAGMPPQMAPAQTPMQTPVNQMPQQSVPQQMPQQAPPVQAPVPNQQSIPTAPAQPPQQPAQPPVPNQPAGNPSIPGNSPSGNPPMGAGAFPFGTVPMGDVFH